MKCLTQPSGKSLDFVNTHQAFKNGIYCHAAYGLCAKFGADVRTMENHGCLRNAEFIGNLLVQFSLDHSLEDLLLALRKQLAYADRSGGNHVMKTVTALVHHYERTEKFLLATGNVQAMPSGHVRWKTFAKHKTFPSVREEIRIVTHNALGHKEMKNILITIGLVGG